VKLDIGKWWDRTPTLANSGDTPVWNLTESMVFEINKYVLNDSKLRVTMMDENKMRKDSYLGSGTTTLESLDSDSDSHILTIDLSDEGETCGRVFIEAVIRDVPIEELNYSIPNSYINLPQGVLNIKSITTRNIIGGDSGLFVSGRQVCYSISQL
jgi:hypothetical protein